MWMERPRITTILNVFKSPIECKKFCIRSNLILCLALFRWLSQLDDNYVSSVLLEQVGLSRNKKATLMKNLRLGCSYEWLLN